MVRNEHTLPKLNNSRKLKKSVQITVTIGSSFLNFFYSLVLSTFNFRTHIFIIYIFIKQGLRKNTEEQVAIKYVTTYVEKYVKREVDCMRLTNHPNIVKLLAYENDEKIGHILVMELYGESLDDRIHPTGLEHSDFNQLCKDLCAATRYLRQLNLIHRDIKPDNILVAKHNDGQITYKLCDFGAARVLKPNEKYTSIHGTFEFCHPDIFAKLYETGLDNVDSNLSFTDTNELWSIGVTLYQAATGQLPFLPIKGRDNYKLMYRMITEKQRGDISATESKKSQIKWSSELPAHALAAHPHKEKVQSYLAGLLNVCITKSCNQ